MYNLAALPNVKVFIIALILSAVIPSLHVNSQMGTKYPFIPGNLPYSPELYEYTAPLGQNLFPYANRYYSASLKLTERQDRRLGECR